MEISAKYDPSQTEDKWYGYWLDHHFFHSEPDDREPYTIVIPPPNVTGVLHMGHMMNNTLQDVLIRRARMLGKNALWVLFIMWPIWSTPVTFGGGMTMV